MILAALGHTCDDACEVRHRTVTGGNGEGQWSVPLVTQAGIE